MKDNTNNATILLSGGTNGVSGGDISITGELTTDIINEKTTESGVNKENVVIKNNNITAHIIDAVNYSVGGTNFISGSRQGNFRDLEVKDNTNNATILLSGGTNGVSGGDISITGKLSTDTIKEKTTNSGVTIQNDTTIGSNLNVLGNLNITGNMNQINSTQITVNDKNIILASNNNADNHIEDGGLILQGATQKSIVWKSANGWKSSEKITAPHLDTVANQLLIGNTQVGLNLNFSGNNLNINGNAPKAGQILTSTGSEVKWADTDYSLVSNQVIKKLTETVTNPPTIFNSASILDLSSSKNFHDTYTP